MFGSSLVQFAIVWFVTLKTSSGFLVAMLTVCAYVPQFIVSFFSGVWADRHSKKFLIILSDSAIAAATLVLALLMPHISSDSYLIYALLVTSAIRSVGAGIQTPAVSAMIPLLVPEDKYMRFNGINATLQSVVQFAAPAAAGAVLTVSTLNTTLFIDIATAAVGIGLLSAVRIDTPRLPQEDKQSSVFSDMLAGMKYAFSDRLLGRVLLLFGAFIFLCVPAGFLATLFVSRTYGDKYLYLTVTELVGFAGMALGGIIMSSWGGFGSRLKTLFVGIFAFGALAVGMGAVRNFVVYLVLMLVYGVALTAVQTSSTTIIQEHAAPEMQGRVFGFYSAMFSGFLPIGMVVFGPLADAVPIRAVMAGSGIALIAIALGGAITIREK